MDKLCVVFKAVPQDQTTWYCGLCLTALGTDHRTPCPTCSPAFHRAPIYEPLPPLGLELGFDYTTNQARRCECGSEKTFGPGAPHSVWCPRAARAS